MDMEHEIKKAEPRLAQDKIRSMDAAEFIAPSAQQAAGSIDTGELRRLAEAATPGPWVKSNKRVPYVKALGVDSYLLHTMPIGDDAKDFHPDTRARWLKDAAYIAAANPAAILLLLNELDMVRSLYEGAHADRMALAAATPAQPIADVSAPTDERAAFEVWARPLWHASNFEPTIGAPHLYNSYELRRAWQAWQAARAAAPVSGPTDA